MMSDGDLLVAPDGDSWDMRDVIADARKKGPLHFANGCFDLFHDGHRHYLCEAAKGSEMLIVGINCDASVRRLKGPLRPINNQHLRFANVCRFMHDAHIYAWVVTFNALTPEALIRAVKPDVLVRGDDTPRPIAGELFVTAQGGTVRIVERLPGISTSQLITQIAARN